MTRPLTSLSDDELLFARSVASFSEAEIRPRVSAMDHAGRLDPALIQGLFDLGLMGIEVPAEHGGAGATFFMSILAIEAIARVDPAVAVLVDVQNTLIVTAIRRYGTDALKARFLPALASRSIGSYALSEAQSGSDAFALACRATREPGGYRLQGRKLWITSARESDVFLVFATVDPEAGHRGITAFLVERDTRGFAIGRAERKLGIRASSTCEIQLDGCFVPDDRVLGEIGKGYKVAIETLNEGRIGIGAQLVGLAAGALDGAVAYAKEREQFGRPLAANQGMQFWLAEMATDVEAARLLVYNAARLRDDGQPFTKEAAMAKWFSSQVAERVASRALEVYGGYGFTEDFPAEKLYRDAKIGKIYEGTSFMQLTTIAKHLLGGPE